MTEYHQDHPTRPPDDISVEKATGHYCVDGKRAGLIAMVPDQMAWTSSVKAAGIPMPRADIDTEFVVAAAEILDEGVPGTDYLR